MKTGIKSIETTDFEEIQSQVDLLVATADLLKRECKGRIDVGHPMKYWEWARSCKAFEELFLFDRKYTDANILDIGAAYSVLGPHLSYVYGSNVTEVEPDMNCLNERAKVNEFLQSRGRKPIDLKQLAYGRLQELDRQFDAIFSISVIEHVDLHLEDYAWNEMAALVRPGGLLHVTADVMPEARKGFMFDDVRWTNFSMDTIKERVERLKACGMKPLGEEDYTYHGTMVHDYSFVSILMVKQW